VRLKASIFMKFFVLVLRFTMIFGVFTVISACFTSKKANLSAQSNPSVFPNVMIASGQKGGMTGPCEPSIAIDFKNPKLVAAGAILDANYWSEDGGKTWKSGKLKSSSGVFGDPVLISDWSGNLYYAHLSDPEGKQWGSEKLLDRIVIQRSTDGGRSYNDGSYCGNHHPKDQDKQWLVADPKTGHLLCTWTEFDKYDSKDTEKDHSRIRFAKSIDKGETWIEEKAISQFEGDCLDDDNTTEGAVPAFGPNGEIYVAWAWNEKIWFDRSLDGGKTWLDKDILAAEQPTGWTYNVPGISRCNGLPILVCDLSNGPNRGTLYLNWSDQRSGEQDTDVFMSKSTDGGKTWTKATRVNDDPKGKQQFLTWMTIDQVTGYLYCVFYDRRAYEDERTDVYLAYSKDGGNKWVNQKISETPFNPTSFVFFGDYNHIAAHNGIVRPIWTRLEAGVLSVWTALIQID
jgi:hypothetical protein